MKLKMIALVLCLSFASLNAKRYMHNTGKTSVIVDDSYCGGFYYHNMLRTDEIDNLWRAFLAVKFNEFGRYISMGLGNDYGETAETCFVKLCTLEVYVETSSVRSFFAYLDSTTGIKIEQGVYSGLANEYWIYFSFIITNLSTRNLTGGKVMFFYDADLPADDFANDYTGLILDHNAVFQYDPIKRIWTGFAFLSRDYRLWCGNYEDWYFYGRTRDAVNNIMNNPRWESSILNTDCAVYEVIEIGDLPPRASTGELRFAFVVGESLKQLEVSVASVWGETTNVKDLALPSFPDINIFPSPFNECFSVVYPFDKPARFELFDITGRLIYTFELQPRSKSSIDAIGFPSGVILYRLIIGEEIRTGKLIHIN